MPRFGFSAPMRSVDALVHDALVSEDDNARFLTLFAKLYYLFILLVYLNLFKN